MLVLLAQLSLNGRLADGADGTGPSIAPPRGTAPSANEPAAARPATEPGKATPPAATSATRTEPAPAGEVKPEMFYVRDKENRLVPVPGFSYEDFVRYYRLKEQLERPEIAPHFSLEQMTIDGQTKADRAELTATFKILATTADWVRVPLRLNKCVLREAAEYKGDGEQFLHFDPAGDGYVCWLRGPAKSEHQLTLKLLAPVAGSGGEGRLELSLPRAAASKLVLRVPSARVAATASPGIVQPELAPAGEGSQISALGVGGDCWLAWREPDRAAAQVSSALEATGAVLVKIDGRSVTSEATLTIHSFGAEFDRFHVQLPPGAQLVGAKQEGYTLTPVEKPAAGSVEVRLDHKTVGPIDVHIATERAYDVTKPDESLELAGFAVAEAIPHRQWGFLAVSVTGDWQLDWGQQTRVRRVGELPEGLRRKGVVAGFEYFGQPSSLTVKVTPRRTRISVEPQFTYTVGAAETQLEARFNYTVRGAKLFELEIEMPGWEIDRVRPETLIDADTMAVSRAGVVSLPLVQPMSGELELALTAHRSHRRGSKQIEWTLPRPRADVVGPAEVAIVPAANIDLVPRPDKLIGLSRATGPEVGAARSETGDPKSRPTTLYYRGEHAEAKFVGDLAIRPREVTIEADQQIAVRGLDSAIHETLNYQIRYAPLEQLTFDVPRDLLDDHQLKFAVGQDLLQPQMVDAEAAAGRVRVQLPLKQPAFGTLRLDVSYAVPHEPFSAAAPSAIAIPLIVPRDGPITANAAAVSSSAAIRVEPRGAVWSTIQGPGRATPDGSLRLTATAAAEVLPLSVSLQDHPVSGSTIADRVWIQTWLTETARQDRIVYRLTSGEEQLRIALPAGIGPDDLELTLDGQSLAPTAGADGALIVPLGADAARREHVLELRYLVERRASHNGSLALEMPRLENRVKIRRTFWELILPSDEHLVAESGDLTPEYAWSWRDDFLGFERAPLESERQLEQWVGLSRLTVAPDPNHPIPEDEPIAAVPQRANRYLFSAAGSEPRLEVVIARRWLLLLVASAAVLSAGLGLIYFTALRRPPVLFGVAGLLVLGAIIYPEPTLLAAQAASLGLALALLALVLRVALRRPRSAPVAPLAPISSRFDRSSGKTSLHYPSEPRQPASTTTTPVALESPSHPSHP